MTDMPFRETIEQWFAEKYDGKIWPDDNSEIPAEWGDVRPAPRMRADISIDQEFPCKIDIWVHIDEVVLRVYKGSTATKSRRFVPEDPELFQKIERYVESPKCTN